MLWWYKIGTGDKQTPLALEADNEEDADLEIQRWLEWHCVGTAIAQGPWKFEEFEGCRSCRHIEGCQESAWDGGNRITYAKDKPGLSSYTSVHSCPTCGEKVIDLRVDRYGGKRNVVPDDCPRWKPMFGSAIDCDACRAERDALRQSHPLYQERADAAMGMMKSMLEVAKENKDLPDGVESLKSKRIRDKSVKAMTAALNPLGAMEGAMDDPKKKAAVVAAAGLQEALWEVVWATDEFKSEWYRAIGDGLDETQQQMVVLEWLDGLYLAIQRHPRNARAMAHEWHLVFTERPVASRAMHNMPDEKRKELLARWEAICEEFIA